MLTAPPRRRRGRGARHPAPLHRASRSRRSWCCEPGVRPDRRRRDQLGLRASLARFKCPTAVEFVDELPHTATGKVSKAGCASSPARRLTGCRTARAPVTRARLPGRAGHPGRLPPVRRRPSLVRQRGDGRCRRTWPCSTSTATRRPRRNRAEWSERCRWCWSTAGARCVRVDRRGSAPGAAAAPREWRRLRAPAAHGAVLHVLVKAFTRDRLDSGQTSVLAGPALELSVNRRHPPAVRCPDATVARLPALPAGPRTLAEAGAPPSARRHLAAAAGVNSAKVRKDLTHLGSYGTRGVGLRRRPADRRASPRELGLAERRSVVIVGIGNLGHALAGYGGFAARGFQHRRAARRRPARVGEVGRRPRGAAA